WARPAPYVVDPSYFSPNAYAALGRVTGSATWGQLAQSSYDVIRQARGGSPPLPPDWAQVGADGKAYASTPPAQAASGQAPLQYGLDADRVLVRMAESCQPQARALAAAAWPFLKKASAPGAPLATAYDLSGHPLKPG